MQTCVDMFPSLVLYDVGLLFSRGKNKEPCIGLKPQGKKKKNPNTAFSSCTFLWSLLGFHLFVFMVNSSMVSLLFQSIFKHSITAIMLHSKETDGGCKYPSLISWSIPWGRSHIYIYIEINCTDAHPWADSPLFSRLFLQLSPAPSEMTFILPVLSEMFFFLN